MQVMIDPVELAPIIAATVSEVMARIRDDETALGDRLAFSEQEAARLLGLGWIEGEAVPC